MYYTIYLAGLLVSVEWRFLVNNTKKHSTLLEVLLQVRQI